MKSNRKQLIGLAVLIFILVAIPLTIYLVKQTQTFKPKAFGIPPLEFSGPGVSEGNPPKTTSQNVQLRLTYSAIPGTSPSPSPSPSPSTQASLTATVSGSGSTVRVTLVWSGIDVSLRPRIYLSSSLFPTADFPLAYPGSCPTPTQTPAAAGSCFFDIGVAATSYQLTVKFKKVLGPGNFVDLVTSNQVEIKSL